MNWSGSVGSARNKRRGGLDGDGLTNRLPFREPEYGHPPNKGDGVRRLTASSFRFRPWSTPTKSWKTLVLNCLVDGEAYAAGLRQVKGFRDEALRGEWKGYRSSHLNLQYRVIYKIEKEQILVQVVDVTAHDYRSK